MNYRFVIGLFFCFQMVCAQQEAIKFERIKTEDGLANEFVNCIFKDSNGFMWFATFDGACRYDGYEFKKYSTDNTQINSLKDNRIHAIYEDSKGVLWFCTQNGLSRYYAEADSFFTYNHSPIDSGSISDNNVRSIVEDEQGIYWVGTYGGGLNKFDPKTSKFISFKNDPSNPSSLPSNRINKVFIDSRKILWVATELGGLVSFDREKKIFRPFHVQMGIKEILDAPIIATIIEDSRHNLWVGAWENGLYKFDNRSHKLIYFKSTPNAANSLNNYNVVNISEDRNGLLWIATYGGGINTFDPINEKFNAFKNDPFDANSLSYDLVWSIYTENTGTVWAGTFGSGICVYDPYKHRFKHFRKNNSEKKTLSSNFITTLFCDSKNNLWLGTSSNGLILYNRNSNSYKYSLDKPNARTGGIRCFFEDENHCIWVGTDEGIVVYDNSFRKIKYYKNIPGKANSLSTNSVEHICKDKEGNMWIATWSNGIYMLSKSELLKINPDQANFVNYQNDLENPESLESNVVWVIHCDKIGNLWIGNDIGIDKFDKKTNSFIHFNIGPTSGIIEKHNELFISTQGFGLYKLDIKTNKLSLVGLKNINSSGLALDTLGNIWLPSANGLYKFDTKTHKTVKFTKKDGLQDNKFNQSAITTSSTGEIFIGGNNGYNVFSPAKLLSETTWPKVIFTDFLVNGKSVVSNNSISIINKQLHFKDSLILQHNPNNFEIVFAALQLSGSADISYRYRLNNFDTCWYYTTPSQRKAKYTNLNPGTYTYLVQASNREGIWPEKSYTLTIQLMPLWYQTYWFKFVVVIVLMGLLYLIYIGRHRQIRNRNKKLTKLVNERTKEIQEKNKVLVEQANSLSESNTLLEERQMQIEEQSEELFSQKEELLLQAEELSKKTEELTAFNEEIYQQKNDLEKAYNELNIYRNQLESLVEERTKAFFVEKEKAVQSDKLKSAFLANMSHEIRTPLNAIVGFANLLKDNDITEEEKDDFGRIIENNSNYLLHLINDILDISKVEAGLVTVDKSIVSLEYVFSDINSIFKEEIRKINKSKVQIELKSELSNELKNKSIYTDPIRLKQIITNLIGNAIKYTPKGFVEFGCIQKTSDRIAFYVKDSGIGISKENQEFIFDRFRKVEDHKDVCFRGTGLGLALVKELVELLDATISVESEPGVGSTFEVTFPIN